MIENAAIAQGVYMVETIRSEPKYQGRAFSVRKDWIRLPNGHETVRDIVEHPGAVTIVPIDADETVWLVRQYRQATRKDILEFPAGTLEPDEPPHQCASREIQEEIGLAAGHLRKLGQFFMSPGYSTEFMHVFLATELSPSPMPCDVDELLAIEKFPLSELLDMALSGEIEDSKTLAALYLAQSFLQDA
jgi:ADP-ribose pyrophosphatase